MYKLTFENGYDVSVPVRGVDIKSDILYHEEQDHTLFCILVENLIIIHRFRSFLRAFFTRTSFFRTLLIWLFNMFVLIIKKGMIIVNIVFVKREEYLLKCYAHHHILFLKIEVP